MGKQDTAAAAAPHSGTRAVCGLWKPRYLGIMWREVCLKQAMTARFLWIDTTERQTSLEDCGWSICRAAPVLFMCWRNATGGSKLHQNQYKKISYFWMQILILYTHITSSCYWTRVSVDCVRANILPQTSSICIILLHLGKKLKN